MVLLVEDNPDDVKLTLRAFKKQKITSEVVIARDGVEATDFLFGRNKYAERDLSQMPGFVLLDLKLPKMDGFDVLRAIRSHKETAQIPVVMMSTSQEEKDIEQSYRLGVNSYIRKPVEYENFSDTLRQLGNYWLLLNISPVKS